MFENKWLEYDVKTFKAELKFKDVKNSNVVKWVGA